MDGRWILRVAAAAGVVVACWPLAGAPAGSAVRTPVWLVHPAAVKAGMPLRFVLDSAGGNVCWVGLRGPPGGATGWRFAAGGRRLELVLFTHADAAAGTWRLSARCSTRGAWSATAVTPVTVGSAGGSGPLSRHGDMRVAFVRVPADPALGLWAHPSDTTWGFKDPSGRWSPAVYLWVATPTGYEEQDAVAITHRTWSPTCTKEPGYLAWRLTRSGQGTYKATGQAIRPDCSTHWKDTGLTATVKASAAAMSVVFSDGSSWKYVRYRP